MKKTLIALAVIAGLAGAAAIGWHAAVSRHPDAPRSSASALATLYRCSMHPQVVSDAPGSCPICGMDLVPTSADHRPESAAAPSKTKTVWRSTMNPNEISDRPGKDSMGMEMVAEEVPVDSGGTGSSVSGLARIRMNAQKRQLIGVRTALVKKQAFTRTLRAFGRVAADETRLRQVTTKIDGYVERLYANAVGEVVRKGQPLLEIYSPELLASQNEYLIALAARQRSAGSSIASVAGFGDELVLSSRRRLQLFDVSEAQIDRLERTGTPERVVTVYAPIGGVITARNVARGQKIESGMALLEVVDLSRVWAIASVYEYELPFVQVGQAATMTLSYVPGKTFEGKVSFVYPTLDPQTRTVQVRVEFTNPDFELKPDMFADVVLHADLGERLAVPDTAVLDTGTRSIAFVETEAGVFEPRELKIGLRLEHEYEVLEGISDGETVVVSANFLLDSESRLKAALAGMSSASEPTPAPAGHAH
jgi:multidrug efflux pump subunit AcrA (membrane-fusion protein)